MQAMPYQIPSIVFEVVVFAAAAIAVVMVGLVAVTVLGFVMQVLSVCRSNWL